MTAPAFELRVVRGESRMHIAPSGELDIATAPQLEHAISEATSEPVSELVLDLRELTFMDSSGLRTLAQANVKAEQAGTALSIWRGPRQIERVLEISGLGPLLPLADAPAD
jgi:anti-anti-sigma factor